MSLVDAYRRRVWVFLILRWDPEWCAALSCEVYFILLCGCSSRMLACGVVGMLSCGKATHLVLSVPIFLDCFLCVDLSFLRLLSVFACWLE